MSSARYCRSLHTQLRRPAHHATALPASCHGSASLGRCAHGPWLALAGWLLSNTVSLDISFSSREHVTRCSLGRATRWACSVRFSTHGGALGNHAGPLFCRGPPSGGVAVYVAENPVLGGPWWSQRPMRAQGAFHVGLLGRGHVEERYTRRWWAVASAGSWRLPTRRAARRGEM